MIGFIVRLLVNAFALIIVAELLHGVEVTSITGAVVAAFVLGIVNAVLRPILILISLPLEILTLGLFTLVINAALFWWVGQWGIGLVVHGFVAAFEGALVLSIVSFLLSLAFGRARSAA